MWYASPCVWNSVLPYRLKINMEANFASWPLLANSEGETFLKSELDWKIVALTLNRFDCSSDCPSIIYPLTINDIKFTSACRGYHAYQKVWKPTLNEELQVCSTPSTPLVSFYLCISLAATVRIWLRTVLFFIYTIWSCKSLWIKWSRCLVCGGCGTKYDRSLNQNLFSKTTGSWESNNHNSVTD